jgi:predicted transcriptional regulator
MGLLVSAMTGQMMTQPCDGAALEKWRRSLGMSREALGAAAGGIASATVKRVERGEVRPHPSTIAALVTALDRATNAQRPDGNRGVATASDVCARKEGNRDARPSG